MRPRSPFRRARAWLVVPLTAALAVTVLSAPAHAANPVTPGNFTGLGFDQCNAPSQSAMSAWRRSSPFRAAGIYISGNSRACRTQANLTPTWVSTQLAAGWHLMPITLGPQASCSSRFPRYGASIDPTISPNSTNTFATARTQGKAEADKAVTAARNLGIVAGSTIFYDLEAFDISNSLCRQSALWFMHAWTLELHALGYASGYYSSAASGIRMLDNQRVAPGNTLRMPDQIWIADWNGKANTASTYVRSDGWQPYRRAHQYQGGHNETWGGVTINIDRNYLDLRTPSLSGSGSTPPPSNPTPPASSTSDPRCSTASINRTAYRVTSSTRHPSLYGPLQCLLKQQHLYPVAVTTRWNTQTLSGLRSFQKRIGHRVQPRFTRSDWTALLAAGNAGTTLRSGTRGADVIRVQRALNAARAPYLSVNGVYDAKTQSAVGAYQSSVGISPTKVVSSQTWAALRKGRR